MNCEVCGTQTTPEIGFCEITGCGYLLRSKFNCNCHDDNEALTVNAREIEVN